MINKFYDNNNYYYIFICIIENVNQILYIKDLYFKFKYLLMVIYLDYFIKDFNSKKMEHFLLSLRNLIFSINYYSNNTVFIQFLLHLQNYH